MDIEAIALYTNNPPCGAMRGFGAVQACFAYEAQMDGLAAALDMDPVEFRQLNAMSQGAVMPTGQVVDSPAPVAELLRRVKAMPMRRRRSGRAPHGAVDVRALPGVCPTPRTAKASYAASATRSASRTSVSPRASTTTPPPGSAWR